MSGSLNRWIAITVLALTGYASSAAMAADVKTGLVAGDAGKIYFNSAERDTSFNAMYRHAEKFDEPIWGELRFPEHRPASKVPAMVIMHGSGGVSQHMYNWVEFFNKMGVATFMVDSFTPRGIKNTIDDQSQLTYAASTADSLRALKLLASHPSIDASKIGVIGFSRGGFVAMASSFEKLRAAVVQDNIKFAVHLPFYAGCTQYEITTGAPIVVFMGTKDETVSIDVCRTNASYMQAQGANLKFVEYEGAHHGFDSDNPRRTYFPRGQTWVKCSFRTDIDRLESRVQGSEHALSGAEMRDYLKSCTSLGWQVAGDPDAYAKSRKEVKDFITQNFGLIGQ